MVFCHKCGSEIEEDDKFCLHCGCDLEEIRQFISEQTSDEKIDEEEINLFSE